MHGYRTFCQRGPALITFCYVFVVLYEGREDPNKRAIIGPQGNAIKMALRLWANDGQTLNWLVALRFLEDPDQFC